MTNYEDAILLITGSRQGYLGTGFIFHRDEQSVYVLTCAHVVKDVGGEEGIKAEHVEAQVIAIGGDPPSPDLAVLRVKNLKGNPLKLCPSGSSGNRFTISGVSSFLKGEVQYKSYQGNLVALGKLGYLEYRERIRIWDLKIDHDEEVKHGHSGSPVIDEKTGCVIGVVRSRQGETRGMAIAIEHLRDIWNDMPPDLLEVGEPTNRLLFEYSCYVSYFFDGSEKTQDFIQELKDSLAIALAPFFYQKKEVYIEPPSRRGDVSYSEERTFALCHSICMVLVFSPPYFKEPYCVREYLAMKNLERQRRNSTRPESNNRFDLVIPIIYKGSLYPEELNRKPFNEYDFSTVSLKRGRVKIESPKHLRYLDDIATYTQRLDDYLQQFNIGNDCKNFALPTGAQAQLWQKNLPPVQPPKLGWR